MTVSNGIQQWTVPQDGIYTIDAYGAQGGYSSYNGYEGGEGARMRGDFTLAEGTILKILVGQEGEDQYYDCGGGGGTFVTTATNTPLVIAAGGGGASASGFNGSGTDYGHTDENGSSTSWASGGVNGGGGEGSNCRWRWRTHR